MLGQKHSQDRPDGIAGVGHARGKTHRLKTRMQVPGDDWGDRLQRRRERQVRDQGEDHHGRGRRITACPGALSHQSISRIHGGHAIIGSPRADERLAAQLRPDQREVRDGPPISGGLALTPEEVEPGGPETSSTGGWNRDSRPCRGEHEADRHQGRRGHRVVTEALERLTETERRITGLAPDDPGVTTALEAALAEASPVAGSAYKFAIARGAARRALLTAAGVRP